MIHAGKAAVVCISATLPAAETYARRLCNQLRSRYPEVHLIVGLCHAPGDLSKAKVRIGGGDTTHTEAT